jgi:hypothetical protein
MTCTGSFITTGVQCTTDGITPGGSFPPDDGGDGGGDDGDGGGDDNGDGDVPFPRLPNKPSHWDGFLSALRGLGYNEYLKSRASFEPAVWSYSTYKMLDSLRREQFTNISRSLNPVGSLITPIHENIADIRHKSLDIAKYEQMNHGLLAQMSQKLDQLVENTSGSDDGPCIPTPGQPPCRSSPEEMHLSAIRNNDVGYSIQRSFEADRLNDSVNALGSGIEAIKGELSGIGDALSIGDYTHRSPSGDVDFSALYQSSAIEELKAEALDLEAQYEQKVNQFRSLLSFDETQLEQGDYNDHSMTFRLSNGYTFDTSSSVFPALIDVSHWIASALIFIAVIAGIRLLGN